MDLQSRGAVYDTNTRLLHQFRGDDVVLLVEPGFDFDIYRHLFSLFGGVEQPVYHFGVFGHPVLGEFYFGHCRVLGGLGQKPGEVVERLIGEMYQKVTVANHLEHRRGVVEDGQPHGRGECLAQHLAGEVGELGQVLQIQIPARADALSVRNVVGLADILQHVVGHAAVVDQPVGVADLAFLDPLAHGIDNVDPLFGLDGKVGIARDPYRIVRVDVESREDDVEVQGNHVVDKHHIVLSVVGSELDKSRHLAERDFYLGIERLSVGIVAVALPIHFNRQIQPVVAQERDDVVFQYQHRLQKGEHLFFKEVAYLFPVALFDFLLVIEYHAFPLEFGNNIVEKEFVEIVDL